MVFQLVIMNSYEIFVQIADVLLTRTTVIYIENIWLVLFFKNAEGKKRYHIPHLIVYLI